MEAGQPIVSGAEFIAKHAGGNMHIPELCYQDKLLEQKSRTRAQKYSGQGGPKNVASCKRAIANFLANTELITPDFSGKLVISFKEGGISYIEKVEQIK